MNSETLISPPNLSPPPPPHSDHPNPLQSMFSSVPTTAKSSKWLHRLRSTRGFPDSDHIDLEHFLATISIDPQTCTDKPPQSDLNFVTGKHDDCEIVQERDSISNLLSELFHMGEFQDTSRTNTKKSSRKQHSPRICLVSTNSNAQNVPIQKVRVSSPLNVTLSSMRKVKETEIVEEDEEKCDWDVSGYSQTEVTVIDTSVASWKFEKILYRKKNVWKIRDKKGKGLMSGDRKKRKESVNENGDVYEKKLKLCSSILKSRDAEVGSEKKKKMKKKKLKLCSSSDFVYKEDDMIRLKSAQGHDQGKKTLADYEKKQDNCSQVQEKRFLKKQIDEGPSVVLIKSIPITNKKDISGISKSCLRK